MKIDLKLPEEEHHEPVKIFNINVSTSINNENDMI
jgi:hypothetical protein